MNGLSGMLVHLITLLSVCLGPAVGRGTMDSKGRTFIIGIMQHIPYTKEPTHDRGPELLLSIDSGWSAVALITTPLYDDRFEVSIPVVQGTYSQVRLPRGIRTGNPKLNVVMEPKAVLISCTWDISVTVMDNQGTSQDAYLALPVDALGLEYRLVTWVGRPQFLVVATEANTTVRITFPKPSPGQADIDITHSLERYRGGDTMTVVMEEFWTLNIFQGKLSVGDHEGDSVVSYDIASEFADFTGTHIVADKPVGVVSGNEKAAVMDKYGPFSFMAEQLAPVQSWGKEFYTYSTPLRKVGDVIKIVASEDHTSVSANPPLPRGRHLFTMQYAGDCVLLVPVSGKAHHLTANKPVQVALFARSLDGTANETYGGAAMSILVPVSQYMGSYSWITPQMPNGSNKGERSFMNMLTVIVRQDKILLLQLDGEYFVVWDNKSTIAGADDKMTVLTKRVAHGTHSIQGYDFRIKFFAVATGVSDVFFYDSCYAYAFQLGMWVARLNDPMCAARELTMAPADSVNNDCDGDTDEEKCDGLDNDGDGEVDEDLSSIPVKGNWGDWILGECSQTCGRGTMTKTRLCNNPPPMFGGRDCDGRSQAAEVVCNENLPCPLAVLDSSKGEGAWFNFKKPSIATLMYVVAIVVPAAVVLSLVVNVTNSRMKTRCCRPQVPEHYYRPRNVEVEATDSAYAVQSTVSSLPLSDKDLGESRLDTPSSITTISIPSITSIDLEL